MFKNRTKKIQLSCFMLQFTTIVKCFLSTETVLFVTIAFTARCLKLHGLVFETC